MLNVRKRQSTDCKNDIFNIRLHTGSGKAIWLLTNMAQTTVPWRELKREACMKTSRITKEVRTLVNQITDQVMGKQGDRLKWRAIKPYIEQLIITLILFIILPSVLFAMDQIEIKNDYGNLSFGLLIVGGMLYFYLIIMYFLPGIYSLFDLITNNFITCKMTYISSYVESSKLFISNKATVKTGKIQRMNERCFIKVMLSDHNGKSMFSTTYYFLMEKDKRYTIQYGKFSRVIVSILSEAGEEMLQCHSES